MTTIKGFVDGILDGTIPPDMQNHYLQLVSEETGRLARLIQNMLALSKLESGEYQVHARMFNIWETITGVALSAEPVSYTHLRTRSSVAHSSGQEFPLLHGV